MNQASRIKLAKELLYCAKMVLDAKLFNADDGNNINQKVDELKRNKSQLLNKKRKKCNQLGFKGQLGQMTVEELIDVLLKISNQ